MTKFKMTKSEWNKKRSEAWPHDWAKQYKFTHTTFSVPALGFNDICPCNSGKTYLDCCCNLMSGQGVQFV